MSFKVGDIVEYQDIDIKRFDGIYWEIAFGPLDGTMGDYYRLRFWGYDPTIYHPGKEFQSLKMRGINEGNVAWERNLQEANPLVILALAAQ